MNPPTIPVHERFSTWQGEGVHMGRAAFFIRTFGCPMHCPWCDSAGTWHVDYVPKHIERLTLDKLVQEAVASGAPMVVITGGEPLIHNLHDLTIKLKSAGLRVHIETSGAFEPNGFFDWVTVSPKNKWAKPMLPIFGTIASEFKLIIEAPEDIAYWTSLLADARFVGQPVWLHPEWSKRQDVEVLSAITNYVKKHGDPFRAGWQLHKLYKADALDHRSATPVPLGGDPSRGY